MLRYAMEWHRTDLQWNSEGMPGNCNGTEILLQEEKL